MSRTMTMPMKQNARPQVKTSARSARPSRVARQKRAPRAMCRTGQRLFGAAFVRLAASHPAVKLAQAAEDSPSLFDMLMRVIGGTVGDDHDASADAEMEGEAEDVPLLDPDTARYYSPTSGTYGTFQGEPYNKPAGWVRFDVGGLDPNSPVFDRSVAYHGTRPEHVLPIVKEGLRSPAERGVESSHGQAGTDEATHGWAMYASPFVSYAAHPVYTPLHQQRDGSYAQVVLQVRVDQQYVEEKLPSTLSNAHWPLEVPFEHGATPNDVMEWLVTDPSAIEVTGVLFREIGTKAEGAEGVYGDVACGFTPRGGRVEYEWTEHCAKCMSMSAVGQKRPRAVIEID